jgi:hypothetical protein
MRIRKQDRIYKGRHDVPKTGIVTVALTRPALDAIACRPTGRKYIFMSKTGRPLSQATLSGYWAQVRARAELEFDFYHATKHFGVHYLWTVLGLSPRAIAEPSCSYLPDVAAPPLRPAFAGHIGPGTCHLK